MLSSNIGQRGGQHQEDLHGRCDDFQQAVSTWSVVRAASVRDGRVWSLELARSALMTDSWGPWSQKLAVPCVSNGTGACCRGGAYIQAELDLIVCSGQQRTERRTFPAAARANFPRGARALAHARAHCGRMQCLSIRALCGGGAAAPCSGHDDGGDDGGMPRSRPPSWGKQRLPAGRLAESKYAAGRVG